jgi:anti-sigma B factor antagonist
MKLENILGVTILRTDHRLDGTNGQKLTNLIKELARESSLKLVMDMGKTNLINRSGCKAIATSLMCVQKSKGEMKIVRPSAKVLEAFQRTQLYKVVDIHDSLESAMDSFGS